MEFNPAGHVYFVGPQPVGLVKIGSSCAPLERLRALQSGSPVPLVLLGSFASDDCLRAEKDLHRRFRATRKHGEWFERTPELLALIGTCRVAPGRLDLMDPRDAARVLTLVEAARALGYSTDAMRKRAQRMMAVPAGRQGNALLYRLSDLA